MLEHLLSFSMSCSDSKSVAKLELPCRDLDFWPWQVQERTARAKDRLRPWRQNHLLGPTHSNFLRYIRNRVSAMVSIFFPYDCSSALAGYGNVPISLVLIFHTFVRTLKIVMIFVVLFLLEYHLFDVQLELDSFRKDFIDSEHSMWTWFSWPSNSLLYVVDPLQRCRERYGTWTILLEASINKVSNSLGIKTNSYLTESQVICKSLSWWPFKISFKISFTNILNNVSEGWRSCSLAVNFLTHWWNW